MRGWSGVATKGRERRKNRARSDKGNDRRRRVPAFARNDASRCFLAVRENGKIFRKRRERIFRKKGAIGPPRRRVARLFERIETSENVALPRRSIGKIARKRRNCRRFREQAPRRTSRRRARRTSVDVEPRRLSVERRRSATGERGTLKRRCEASSILFLVCENRRAISRVFLDESALEKAPL